MMKAGSLPLCPSWHTAHGIIGRWSGKYQQFTCQLKYIMCNPEIKKCKNSKGVEEHVLHQFRDVKTEVMTFPKVLKSVVTFLKLDSSLFVTVIVVVSHFGDLFWCSFSSSKFALYYFFSDRKDDTFYETWSLAC